MATSERVGSPCVSICALDEDDICIGCQRSGDEITRWGGMSDDERRQVLAKLAQREKKAAL